MPARIIMGRKLMYAADVTPGKARARERTLE